MVVLIVVTTAAPAAMAAMVKSRFEVEMKVGSESQGSGSDLGGGRDLTARSMMVVVWNGVE